MCGVAGMSRPSSGSVRVGGYDVVKQEAQACNLLGVCPRHTTYSTHMTAMQHLVLFAKVSTTCTRSPHADTPVKRLLLFLNLRTAKNRKLLLLPCFVAVIFEHGKVMG